MRFSLFLLIFMVSCSQVKQSEIVPVPEQGPPDFEELNKTFTVCTGAGIITSRGTYSGQLRFRFTSELDSSNIRFTDILGRQVIEIIMVGNSLVAKDLLKDRRYSNDQLTAKLPFLKVFSAQDLRNALWGIPPVFSADGAFQTDMEIKLESETTEYGVLLQRIIITGENKTNMVIQFLSRKMGYDISGLS